MATLGDIVVNLRMNSGQFSSSTRGARRDLSQLSRSSRDFGGNLNALTPSIGTVSTALAGLLITREVIQLFDQAGDAAAEFGRKLQTSFAIQDLSIEHMAAMRAEALRLSTDPAIKDFGPQLAEGYFFLASAGQTAEQQIGSLERVARFATAGNFDLALATDLATDAQSSLGMTVSNTQQNLANLTRVTDTLVKANTLANASVQQFSESLTSGAGAASKTVGKDIEETLAVLAAFADQGVKGADAGTKFAIVMRDLQTKALANRAAFEAANIAVFDQAGEMRNLADIISDVERRLDGLSDANAKAALLALGFSDKSVGALQTLLGTSDGIRKYEAALRDAGGTVDEVSGRSLTQFDQVSKQVSATWQEFLITMGDEVNVGMSDVMQELPALIKTTGTVINTTLVPAFKLGAAAVAETLEAFNAYVAGLGMLRDEIAAFAVETFDVTVPVTVDSSDTAPQIERMMLELQSRVRDITINPGADFDAATVAGLQSDLDSLRSRAITVGINVADSPLATLGNDIDRLGDKAKQLEKQIAAAVQPIEAAPFSVDLTEAERLGDSIQAAYEQSNTLLLRMDDVRDAYAAGTMAVADYENATAHLMEQYDKLRGGAFELIATLERETALINENAAARRRVELADSGAGIDEINRVGQLQRQLAVRELIVDQARQLAAIEFGADTVDLAASLEINAGDLDEFENRLQSIRDRTVAVGIEADGQPLSALREQIAGIQDAAVGVGVTVDDQPLSALRDQLSANQEYYVNVGMNVEDIPVPRELAAQIAASTTTDTSEVDRLLDDLSSLEDFALSIGIEVNNLDDVAEVLRLRDELTTAKQLERDTQQAQQITASVRTPGEDLRQQLAELDRLSELDLLDTETLTRGMDQAKKTFLSGLSIPAGSQLAKDVEALSQNFVDGILTADEVDAGLAEIALKAEQQNEDTAAASASDNRDRSAVRADSTEAFSRVLSAMRQGRQESPELTEAKKQTTIQKAQVEKLGDVEQAIEANNSETIA